MALLYGAIGVFHVLFRKKFLAISLDPETARRNYDDFLKVSIAKAQLAVGDPTGFATLVKVLGRK